MFQRDRLSGVSRILGVLALLVTYVPQTGLWLVNLVYGS